ncbi:ribonuclease P protein component [Helicobacter cynogastricus]|uniref:ribonuclease P protein component n=1 Tax=Helicobacter cynogastricus TaxID=329937 RepID=UPI0018F8268B|nr:ribonuclease P protein component [Helicobacter cynogastricus]
MVLSLKTNRQFNYVYKKGVKKHQGLFMLYTLPLNPTHRHFLGIQDSVLGLSVSKKVGNAVQRNLIKRRVRAVFQHLPLKSPQAIVFVAKAGLHQLPYALLQDRIQQCLLSNSSQRVKKAHDF